MSDVALRRPRGVDLDRELERHRVALTGYCYRMLGGLHEAEDAVQETMLRAWRGIDGFSGRSTLRAWLYRIATNVCVDVLRGRKRRALPMDLVAPSKAAAQVGNPRPEATWVQPAPDGRVLPSSDDPNDPAQQVVAHESIRLAFVAALQHLSPRQRAVVILRDVLRWKASEVAQLLDSTVVSVNSALQRGRAALAAGRLTAADGNGSGNDNAVDPLADPEARALLDRYVDAFERFDVDALVSTLHDDVTFSMPPFDFWLRGLDTVAPWLDTLEEGCRNTRFVPAGTANGMPAFGQYQPNGPDGLYVARSIVVIEIGHSAGARITAVHTFLDPTLFGGFDLPLQRSFEPVTG